MFTPLPLVRPHCLIVVQILHVLKPVANTVMRAATDRNTYGDKHFVSRRRIGDVELDCQEV